MHFLLTSTFLLSLAISTETFAFKGKVVSVIDGDTIGVLSGRTYYKVRLAGIDAPEKKQPYGAASKRALSNCAFGETVKVVSTGEDKYHRLLAKIYVGSLDCNLEQVKKGMAWHYKKYAYQQSETDRTTYAEAHKYAKENKIGLWSKNNPIKPSKFRKSRKK